jgi:uncharacterized protein YecA (UPF0149 family)
MKIECPCNTTIEVNLKGKTKSFLVPCPSCKKNALVVIEPSPPMTVQASGRIGRNDRCRCGSGKKAKKCCQV